jgi:putrescine aminotransferase
MPWKDNEPSIETVKLWDDTHNVHPWKTTNTLTNYSYPIIDSAKGIYIWDESGKRLIDGPGGMWCVQIGYGRQEMADAIANQVLKLPYTSPWSTTTQPAALLAKKIADFAPGDLNNVFFTTGGSTAVDTAIRSMHFMNNRLNRPEKKIVISREKGYHGSTYLAATVSGKERDKSRFDVEKRLVHFLPDVNPFNRLDGTTINSWCDEKVNDLETAILNLGANNVGAFIAEPILCSGGVIIPPDGYHKRTLEICHKYDVLYISDEVVTGFGRLGHWFASKEVFDIVPDIITCAKGLTSGYLPLGACIISDKVMDRLSGTEDVSFSNGYTYSAHPVSCAAALKNIQIFEDEKILDHVKEVSPHFQQRLLNLKKYPIVADLRGKGLLGCIDMRLGKSNSKIEDERTLGELLDEACLELGLIVRPLINMCVFSPPLIITKVEIDLMFDIIEKALDKVTKAMSLSK